MHSPLRRPRNLLLLMIVAALCFGGSFTCKGSTHDDDRGSNGSSVTVHLR